MDYGRYLSKQPSFSMGRAPRRRGLAVAFLMVALTLLGSSAPARAIVGGEDAAPWEFPYVVSIQRLSGDTWVHTGAGVIISEREVLTSAHQVDGMLPSRLRAVAYTNDLSDLSGAQINYVDEYKYHEYYNSDEATYSSDLAVVRFTESFVPPPWCPWCPFATLPPDNRDNFAGDTATIVGWGRTSSGNMPARLQKAQIGVISTAEAQVGVINVKGARVWDNHLACYDPAENVTACNGDGGGPVLVYDRMGGYWVAGTISWGISSRVGDCLASYPMFTTRTSAYVDWIVANVKSTAPEAEQDGAPRISDYSVPMGTAHSEVGGNRSLRPRRENEPRISDYLNSAGDERTVSPRAGW